jgi:hypothetical protein
MLEINEKMTGNIDAQDRIYKEMDIKHNIKG